MARLVQKAGEDQITHELLFNITSVGWGALNDVVIPDPGEKRVHAEIVSLGRHVGLRGRIISGLAGIRYIVNAPAARSAGATEANTCMRGQYGACLAGPHLLALQ